jgi:transketolase
VARAIEDRPSLIVARTHIGFGSPHKQDTWHAHGEPLGAEEVRVTKRALGWPEDRTFYIPDEALREFRHAIERGAELEAEWRHRVDAYRATNPDMADRFARMLGDVLPDDWETTLPVFTPESGEMATRDAGGVVMNALAAVLPNLVGGSADLDPSTRTVLQGCGDFESPRAQSPDGRVTQGTAGGVWGYAGRNIHFGLREHAMAAVTTGMACHGGVLPFGATFLSFADYMRPSIRLAALSRVHVIYIWTHDSIALGEDGPTHQPVEQLATLRAMPNMMVLRPSDATETVEAWRVAVAHTGGPVGLVLTRQNLPVIDRKAYASASGLAKGAYVLAGGENSRPDVILIATGSEVSIALQAHDVLTTEGIHSRVVSMPSWELFERQSQSYREAVLPPSVRVRVSIEAASPFGWERYVGSEGAIIGTAQFGASAPGPVVMRERGFTPEHIVETAKALLTGDQRTISE